MAHIGDTRDFSGSRDPESFPDDRFAAVPDPEDSHAVDEQLAAILEAIRSWDWRAGIFADDGTLKRGTEPAGRHVSKLHSASDPLSSFSGLFVEPSIDAIGSHHPNGVNTYPASDPRPLIEDPLEPPGPPSGDGSDRPARDLTATPNSASPPRAMPMPPTWTPLVAPSATPPPLPFSGLPLAPETVAIAPPAASPPPPPLPHAPVETPAALVETQAALVETPAAPVETPAALVETPAAAVETEAAPVETPPSPVDASPSPVATPSTDGAAPPPAFIAPVGVDPEPPASVEAPADVVAPVAAAVGADATAPKPGPEAGTSAGEPVPPRWWVKYVMWLGTAIIVVIIVAIIRSNTPGSTPNPPVSPNSASSGASSTKPVQVSGTVLTQFTGISQTLDTANVAATKALANGSSQSVAQVATEVAPYLTALDTFNFDLHLMTWPTAMEVPSQELTLRTQSLASFLGSVLSANAASLSTWFTQFHALAQETQAADNVVRRDIGLPLTTNYP